MMLVYGFDGTPDDVDAAVEEVLNRARGCPELRMRVSQSMLEFPHWVSGQVQADQGLVHHLAEPDWPTCLQRISGLVGEHQLDNRSAMWRVHVFPGVTGVPGSTGISTVVVLQMSHALADGARSAVLAGILFGRAGEELQPIARERARQPVTHGLQAIRWRRRFARDIENHRVEPPITSTPPLSINTPPTGKALLRTLVRRRSELPPYPITVGSLIAVSEALSGYLRARGEDPSQLTALVPMAVRHLTSSHNRHVPEFVRLYPDITSRDERAQLIAADMEACRRRRQHPAFAAEQRALAALPGPMQHWLASRVTIQHETTLANTSVSSIYRGAADLSFGGCPVFMTAGFPYLTRSIGLAHGVHGIGETVAFSVHTAESVIADIDEYMERLDVSLRP